MKKKNKKEKTEKIFDKFKKIVDYINNEEEDFADFDGLEKDVLGNLALKAEDLVYNLEKVWEIKPDDLSEKERDVLINLLKSSKKLRNKIIKIIEDIKFDDPNIGKA